jgi:hypothetical protein
MSAVLKKKENLLRALVPYNTVHGVMHGRYSCMSTMTTHVSVLYLRTKCGRQQVRSKIFFFFKSETIETPGFRYVITYGSDVSTVHLKTMPRSRLYFTVDTGKNT